MLPIILAIAAALTQTGSYVSTIGYEGDKRLPHYGYKGPYHQADGTITYQYVGPADLSDFNLTNLLNRLGICEGACEMVDRLGCGSGMYLTGKINPGLGITYGALCYTMETGPRKGCIEACTMTPVPK